LKLIINFKGLASGDHPIDTDDSEAYAWMISKSDVWMMRQNDLGGCWDDASDTSTA